MDLVDEIVLEQPPDQGTAAMHWPLTWSCSSREQMSRDREEVNWRPSICGCIIGAVPWIAIAAKLIVSATGNGVPGFLVRPPVTPPPGAP